MITYHQETDLSIDEFRDILIRSTLGERRPINQPDRLESMLQHGNLILTARVNGTLIGIARSLTDFKYCTYLSDLAVDIHYLSTSGDRQGADPPDKIGYAGSKTDPVVCTQSCGVLSQDWYEKMGSMFCP